MTLKKSINLGTVVSFQDDSTGETLTREYTATKSINKGQAPNLSEAAWKKLTRTIMKLEKNFFPPYSACNVMLLIELDWVPKDLT